jgi:carboxymethylenebutenolidase
MPYRRKRIPENSIQCRVFKHNPNSGVCCAERIEARSSQVTGRGGRRILKINRLKRTSRKHEKDAEGRLDDLFDEHIAKEFVDRDVDATMATMVFEPYVYNVPTMVGGFGGEGVRRSYSEHFVNQIPKDAVATPISRTIGKDQVVDELIVSFTHDTQWDYLLPGLPPTGKRVELPHVVVMKFENGKVAHEHILWDQASLLVQVGVLDPANLPVRGVEQAREWRIAQSQGLVSAKG